MNAEFGLQDRARHVRAASAIGLWVGGLFSVFNLLQPGLRTLGLIELAAVLLLVAPSFFFSHTPSRVALAESLLLLASAVIFGALMVAGGIQGTGLFWVYTLPFLAFFLKGERLGWVYSLVFLAAVALYFGVLQPTWSAAYPHPPVVALHFVLSLAFYTLVAAAFNHVRSRYETQLQQGKAQAEAAYASKSRFLAAASHDLRQPAHALGLFVATLKQRPLDAQSTELVQGVESSVRALQDMLNAFFDYSRLDAPQLAVTPKAFPVNPLFEQLHNSFAAVAAGKGLRLRLRPSPLWLQTDPVLLQRVLLNLVSNAVNYTETGGVLVACRRAQGGQAVRIEVWDSGLGIAPEEQSQVFEEFYQVGNGERNRAKGLGLGLSIVRRTCEVLQLNLTLRSVPGKGSCFALEVPRALSPAASATPPSPGWPLQSLAFFAPDLAHVAEPLATPAAAATTAASSLPASDLQGMHVLLLEDDVLGGDALVALLQNWGCRVSRAESAAAACELARQCGAVDVLVSDYRLPGPHTGLDAVRMLRPILGDMLPACIISGDTASEVRAQVQAAGLVLLQKPVRPAKLRSVLRHAGRAQTPLAAADESANPCPDL